MPKGVLVYLSFHEPRRLRLPAASIADGKTVQSLQDVIIDQQISEHFFETWLEDICRPYTRLLRQMLSDGARFMINVSGPLLEWLTASKSRSALSFISLLGHSKVTFVCSEAKHSLSCYLDIEQFVRQTKKSYDLALQVGISPVAVVAPQMCLSSDIYYALASLPFSLVIADGCQDTLLGRSSGFLRRNGWGPFIATRNSELSLRITSMLNAPPEPMFDLRAAEIAEQVANSDGDYVLLGWQVPSPDSRDTIESGLRFVECLCSEMLKRRMEFIDIRKRSRGDQIATQAVLCF
ncbi:MAG: hypothetical protein M1358_22820 [Chloroflexi bacterium]|nr:hypothetical protein [Chloroflexota bacterium]